MASPFTASKPHRSRPEGLDPASVHQFVEDLLGEDLHAKRVLSLANGVVGVLHGATLAIHAIGQGLATATGATAKHAVKQIDRMLSNLGIDIESLAPRWVSFVIAERDEIVVALDWTDFDDDDQTTLVLNVITNHGRATPLLWKTVPKKGLKTRRNGYEDELLLRLREAVPVEVRVTILADRGFGDQKLYTLLRNLDFHFVIRFRGNIRVTSASGEARTAAEWLRADGRLVELRGAGVTAEGTTVDRIVIVRAKGMKEAWYLASSRADLSGAETKKLYGRRFTIEENLRDTKDLHFGLGLSATHIGDPLRGAIGVLLLVAFAEALLTLLGAASESLGFDRMLKVNTTKKRTHSLFRQGSFWYQAIPTMREDRLRDLMTAFENTVAQHAVFRGIFGAI